MNKIIPLFTSHFSFGKSILTLDKPIKTINKVNIPIDSPDKIDLLSPVSILSIAKSHKLPQIFLVESNMSGFVEAYQNCSDCKIPLRFGLKLTVCEDIDNKSDDSFRTASKVIIFLKNSDGYKDLVRIYSKAATDGFYYIPRISWSELDKRMTNNLGLAIPFYDSFLHKNLLHNGNCVPIFNKKETVIFYSDMELPFDKILLETAIKYADTHKMNMQEVSPVYYYSKDYLRAYMTHRAINNRATFCKPELEFFCSQEFNFISYLNKEKSS